MKAPTLRPRRTEPPEQGTEFVPIAEEARNEAPRATIDPDRSLSWLRRALPVMKAHRGIFITSLTLSFLGLVLQVQIPNLLQQAIGNSITHHTVPLSHYVWWIVGLGLVGAVMGYIARLLLFETAYDIEYDLRNIIYEHLTRMSFSFYDRVQTGQLISRANSDIRSVQMYMTFAPLIMVQCSIAVVAFIFMLTINVPLAFIAMATTPFVYITGVRMRRSMFPVSWIIQARLAEVATIVDENVNGVRVVKSFAAEQQQLRALSGAAEKVQWGYIKDADLRARFTPLVQNLPQLGLVLVLLFGGYMVIHGQLGIGAILAFNAYLLMLQAPFMMLGMLIMMGQRAAASAERIYEIIDEEPTVTDKPDAVDLTDCRGDVRFSHVDFAYDSEAERLVLADFDLHIAPGETVALVGRTGAGKSTVARLLNRFYDVRHGSIQIDGHDVRDLTLSSLRANIGVVLDEPFLFSVSVRDNIAYGKPSATFDEVEAAARAAGAHEFISHLENGYDTVVGERGYTLSGGQRQRIAIARTLLVNPPIMVLDDATSAIDVQVEQMIHASLRVQMLGRTTLIIAHRLSTIALADRVVLLDQQKVVADGTHAELLESTPLYAEVLAQAAEFERDADLEGSDDADVVGPDEDGRRLADLLESVRGGAHR
ncbi:MAG TPA: ABC transporter ATP-binding protein [Acidimicrobiales bacterium]|nr:ABC transporter ATP-binding protein [Acidimicrobiales bacterium]